MRQLFKEIISSINFWKIHCISLDIFVNGPDQGIYRFTGHSLEILYDIFDQQLQFLFLSSNY